MLVFTNVKISLNPSITINASLFFPPYLPDLNLIEKNGLKLRLVEKKIFVLSTLYLMFFDFAFLSRFSSN